MVHLEKILTIEPLRARLDGLRNDGRSIVFANGCFDILHGGHISYLEGAAGEGDVLVVGLNSDRSIRVIKGENRPIVHERDRAEIIAAMEMVDFVILFDEPNCENLLEQLRPDVHAKGTDYSQETVPERETALRLGIRIAITGNAKENATRGIIERIQQGMAQQQ